MTKVALANFNSERIQKLFTEIAKLITSSLELPRIMNAIMKEIEYFFQPHNWSLLRLDPISKELFFVIAKGVDESLIKNVRLKLGEGIAGQVAKTKKAMFINDVEEHSSFSKKADKVTGFKTKSLIAVPIVFQNEVLGVIELINAINDRNFTERELITLETIADFSAIALTNAITYERVAWYSEHDALTRLYNRARLEQLIEKVEKNKASRKHAVVILVDVNDFKAVNDKYGHQAGDEVLCKTASLLQTYCEEKDFAFRTGGDEFLIVITDLQESDVPVLIENLVHRLKLDTEEILPARGFSFGIASGLESHLQHLMKEADKHMYQHKAANKGKKTGSRSRKHRTAKK